MRQRRTHGTLAALVLTACAAQPRDTSANIDVAPASNTVESKDPPRRICESSTWEDLRRGDLARLERLVVFDAWYGLGTSYELSARLDRFGDKLAASMTLKVMPYDDGSLPPVTRFDAWDDELPLATIEPLLDTVAKARLDPTDGNVELAGLDDSPTSELTVTFGDKGPPVFLSSSSARRFAVQLERRFRLETPDNRLYTGFRELVTRLGLEAHLKPLERP
ncbi:MAG: hypothetical protein U0271_41065 [Polyangiaceae bacterium]